MHPLYSWCHFLQNAAHIVLQVSHILVIEHRSSGADKQEDSQYIIFLSFSFTYVNVVFRLFPAFIPHNEQC